ncbi:hypothetical protein STEG23_036480, partial [Scotinomys teguina]
NLLLIIFVSYFGTKLHRPIVIGVGCVVMGLGCFLISLPHFLMDRYEYETTISPASNVSSNSFLCSGNRTQTLTPTPDPKECVKEIKSLMWIYAVVGNIIRGIGETPVMPLGISYIEDFAKSENSPLYIGILETGMVIGPLIGLLLGSFCANIYVDTGSVNTDDLTITPTDTRWVGAWWIGFLICAGVNILTSIPFFFFPKTLPKEGQEDDVDVTKSDQEEKHQGKTKEDKRGITKDFLPFMKSLSCNPIYMLFILISVLQFNAFINTFTFMPKYLEQQYGKSTAEIVFLIDTHWNKLDICPYIFIFNDGHYRSSKSWDDDIYHQPAAGKKVEGKRKLIYYEFIQCDFISTQMFLLALAVAYVAKSLSGTYMNSMLTQIERQFNIPTSIVGLINGSFEIECMKEIKSSMWIYVMVGNVIRGAGETPIMPFGISYIEDFAKSENSPLYIGILKIGTVIGPLIGLMLASFSANIYVDTGFVNTDIQFDQHSLLKLLSFSIVYFWLPYEKPGVHRYLFGRFCLQYVY